MKYFVNKKRDIVICRADNKLPTQSIDLCVSNLVRHAGYWHKTRINQPVSVAYFSGFEPISKEEANQICKHRYEQEVAVDKKFREAYANNPF